MPKLLINLLIKPVLILLAAGVTGLLFGILPCYLFPLFGANERNWCGYKSEPPHFLLQFWMGFTLMAVIITYFTYFKKR
jgi:hypothetical protein